MHRRDFFASLAASAAARSLLRGGNSLTATVQAHALSTIAAKLERVAISSWSLHNYFRATRREGFTLPGSMLALLDFPEMIADKYEVHHLEIYTPHFASTETAYLQELKYQLVHARSSIVNLAVDLKELEGEGTFSDPDRRKRNVTVEAAKKWVDIAHTLAVQSVRCDPGTVTPENLAWAAESFRALAAYAMAKGVHVVVENQEDFGANDPEIMLRFFKLVGPGRIGAMPNFSNFPDEPTREKGLKLLIPYAQNMCYVKGLEFTADGASKGYNFPKAMAIAKKAGFRGIYTIQFDGSGNPYAAIQRTLDELISCL